MKQLLIATLALAALSTGTAFAKATHAGKEATKVELKSNADKRAEKARRQIAADLHWRGSNIPPAFSADGRWSR